MQDLMKQIVDLDRQAREITDSAQKEKVDSEKEVVKKREQLRNDYLEQARKKISENEPKERAVAEAEWQEKNKKNLELSKGLDDLYREKGDQWVAEIMQKVLGA